MGWQKPDTRVRIEVMQSTHGQTFVTWPIDMAVQGSENLPALPVGQNHARSRQWVLADRTVVLILPGDGNRVVRRNFDVVSASWNTRTKTLVSLVKHPSAPDASFVITTSGVGCSCTQGPAGNAGPIEEPYEIHMTNPNAPEFDWFTVVTP